MKTNLLKSVVLVASLLGALGIASAETLHAKIPFGFSAGGKAMPAGVYTIRAIPNAPGVLLFENETTKMQAIVFVRSGSRAPAKPRDTVDVHQQYRRASGARQYRDRCLDVRTQCASGFEVAERSRSSDRFGKQVVSARNRLAWLTPRELVQSVERRVVTPKPNDAEFISDARSMVPDSSTPTRIGSWWHRELTDCRVLCIDGE